jgi:ubiquinone/menaquinone biosynthesis C-methylase UbiE
MPYPDGAFAHAYSVGSLEHFTTEGIVACLAEVNRVSKGTTFHQVPTSRSNRNEGWITTVQSYHNNSAEWWLQVVRDVYPRAVAVGSSWSDTISVGTWLVCRI